jgi:hypothetical protein
MKTNIYDLLPELSDENAYHLVNFLMNLALELESHYFAQIRRYVNNDILDDHPAYLQNEPDDKLPF